MTTCINLHICQFPHILIMNEHHNAGLSSKSPKWMVDLGVMIVKKKENALLSKQHKQTDRQTDKQTYWQTNRQADKHTHTHSHPHTHTYTNSNTQTNRQIDTHSNTETQTNILTDKLTGRQTHTHTLTHIHTHTHNWHCISAYAPLETHIGPRHTHLRFALETTEAPAGVWTQGPQLTRLTLYCWTLEADETYETLSFHNKMLC